MLRAFWESILGVVFRLTWEESPSVLHCKEVTLQAPTIVAKSNNVIFAPWAIAQGAFVFCFFGAFRSIWAVLRLLARVRKLLRDFGFFLPFWDQCASSISSIEELGANFRATFSGPLGCFFML